MTENIKKPLVLLLGNYRPSLILARMFKKRGFSVAVGTHGCERLCQYSNAVSSMWNHSPLNGGPTVLAAELQSFADQNPDLIAIYPVAEEYVRLMAEHEELFRRLPPIVSMKSGLVKKCLSKDFMLTLARENGVPTAPFAQTRGLPETSEIGKTAVGYPMVLRPVDSTSRIDGNKAVVIDTEDALSELYQKHRLEHQDVLLQRKFQGTRHNVYFAAIDGDVTRVLHAVIDRTDKVDGTGLAVEGRTLGTDHDLVAQTGKLLKALNYSGIGCAQFLVNVETGETSFLEINPRIAGNHALPEHAGLDLGWFNFERIVHNRICRRQVRAAAGLRYCWSTGDLMGAKVAFLRKEIGLPALLAWSARAVMTAIRSDLHMVFSLRDPRPAIRGVWNLVPRIARWRTREISPGESTIYSTEEQRLT